MVGSKTMLLHMLKHLLFFSWIFLYFSWVNIFFLSFLHCLSLHLVSVYIPLKFPLVVPFTLYVLLKFPFRVISACNDAHRVGSFFIA